MGGEKNVMPILPLWMLGSPPRGRGKVIVYITAWRVAGITPALAGKSFPVTLSRMACTDHPRMGGEKMGVGCPEYILLGLPPRRRGKGSPQ